MTGRMVALDTETTGLEPSLGHRVTEVALVEIIDRQVTGRTFQTYLNPERELDEAAARITGLSYGFLKDKPKFSEVIDDFWAFLFPLGAESSPELIIHNAPFDLKFLNAELTHCGHKVTVLQKHASVIDTLVLAKRLFPGHRGYSLDALCQRHGVDNQHREKHGALLDAEILAEVYLRMTAGQETLAFSGAGAPIFERKSSVVLPGVPGISTEVEGSRRARIKVIPAEPDSVRLHEARLAEISD